MANTCVRPNKRILKWGDLLRSVVQRALASLYGTSGCSVWSGLRRGGLRGAVVCSPVFVSASS